MSKTEDFLNVEEEASL